MGKQSVYILLFFLNLLIHNAYAYNLKQVADKEYMSNSSITSLCQDERGLMWIGTCDGLNIYDGQEIEEFKTRDKEDYLSGNLIDNIVYTGEDVYWIQTYYGLNRLNRKTNTITHYNEFQKLFFMNKDSHGNLFIIQDSNCIYYYHKKEGVFKKINITGIPISDIVNFFIDAGNGGGIGWALIDDITHAEVKEEIIINHRHYHTIKEVKNGEGPHPIKTPKGWLHLAHGVRACAAGLRYVLYLYMTSLEDPTKIIAEPGGYLIAPVDEERIGDVSNVLFSNGWIADEDGTVYIYYASSDTRMHVATSTVDRLIDYCLHTPADGLRSAASVENICKLIEANKYVMAEQVYF